MGSNQVLLLHQQHFGERRASAAVALFITQVRLASRTLIQMYGGSTLTQISGSSLLFFKDQESRGSSAPTCSVRREGGSKLSQRLGPLLLTLATCWNIGLIVVFARISTASSHHCPKRDTCSHLATQSLCM